MLLWLELPLSALRSLCKDLRAPGQQLQSKTSKGSAPPRRHSGVSLQNRGNYCTSYEHIRTETPMTTNPPSPWQDRGFNIRGDQRRWHLTGATACQAILAMLLELHRPGPPCALQFSCALFNVVYSAADFRFFPRCRPFAGHLGSWDFDEVSCPVFLNQNKRSDNANDNNANSYR